MLLLWTAMVSAWGAAFVTKIESCSFDFSFYLFFPHNDELSIPKQTFVIQPGTLYAAEETKLLSAVQDERTLHM